MLAVPAQLSHHERMARIQIMVDGREALTPEQVADLAGISPNAVRMLIKRLNVQPVARLGMVYDRAGVEAMLESRPGRGAPGVPRPHRPPAAE
jgi:hypothetical protein